MPCNINQVQKLTLSESGFCEAAVHRSGPTQFSEIKHSV